MNNDYIIFQVSKDGKHASVGLDGIVNVSSEIAQGLVPKEKNEMIQFGRLLLEDVSDEFASLFENYSHKKTCEELMGAVDKRAVENSQDDETLQEKKPLVKTEIRSEKLNIGKNSEQTSSITDFLMRFGIDDEPFAEVIINRLIAMKPHGDQGDLKGVSMGNQIDLQKWDFKLGHHDMRDVLAKKPFDVEVLSTDAMRTFFMVGEMPGYVSLAECPRNLFPGDVITVVYEGRIEDQCIVCKWYAGGKRHYYFPFIEPEMLDDEEVSAEGFCAMCKIQCCDDDGVSVVAGNHRYVMDPDQCGAVPNYNIERTGFVGITMPMAITGEGKVSRKFLLEQLEYQKDWPFSDIEPYSWEGWMKWRLWRHYPSISVFRNGNKFVAVGKEIIEQAFCTREPLKVGQKVEICNIGGEFQLKQSDLNTYEQTRPHNGDLVSARLYRKDSSGDWLLGGDNWIGRLTHDENVKIQKLVSGRKLLCKVMDYLEETHEVICSHVNAVGSLRDGEVIDAQVIASDEDGICVKFYRVDIVVTPLSTRWKQKALAHACPVGTNVKLWIKEVNWDSCQVVSQIVGTSDGLFSESVPETGNVIMAKVLLAIEEGYLLKTETGYGLMPVEEGLEDRKPELEFVDDEDIEVMVIRMDIEESKMPILSYRNAHQPSENSELVVGQTYDGWVLRSSEDGVLAKLFSPNMRVFMALRYVYTWKDDYDHHRIVQGQRLKTTYYGKGRFYSHLIQSGLYVPDKGSAEFAVCSVSRGGMNLWNDEGRLVWITGNQTSYKKKVSPTELGFRAGDKVCGWYIPNNPLFITATLKAHKKVTDTYPIDTVLQGVVVEYNSDNDTYLIDLGMAWGIMTSEDVSWILRQRHLNVGQHVTVTVARLLDNLNYLGVTMLTTEPFGGKTTTRLTGTVTAVNNKEIQVNIGDITTFADAKKAQEVFGIDNFGKIKLRTGSVVKVLLKIVDLNRRRIYVEIFR